MAAITEIDIAGIVTVARADGEPLGSDVDGLLQVDASGFGIDAGGNAYFDPNGATAGERAVLGLDAAGALFLERS